MGLCVVGIYVRRNFLLTTLEAIDPMQPHGLTLG